VCVTSGTVDAATVPDQATRREGVDFKQAYFIKSQTTSCLRLEGYFVLVALKSEAALTLRLLAAGKRWRAEQLDSWLARVVKWSPQSWNISTSGDNCAAENASPETRRQEKCSVYRSQARRYVDFWWDTVARKNLFWCVTFSHNVLLWYVSDPWSV